jgi:hypothetical protein
VIDGATLQQFDPHGTAFANVNTPDDVLRVRTALRAGDVAGKH